MEFAPLGGGSPSPACLVLLPSAAGILRLTVGKCWEGDKEGRGSKAWSVCVGSDIKQVMLAFRAPDSEVRRR